MLLSFCSTKRGGFSSLIHPEVAPFLSPLYLQGTLMCHIYATSSHWHLTAAQYMLTGMEGLLIFTGFSTHHLLLTCISFETTGTKCKASVSVNNICFLNLPLLVIWNYGRKDFILGLCYPEAPSLSQEQSFPGVLLFPSPPLHFFIPNHSFNLHHFEWNFS